MNDKIPVGTLIKSKDEYIYLWDKYDYKENSMEGQCYFQDKIIGLILDVKETKNTSEFGWIAKIATVSNNGNQCTGWIWCDMIEKV